MPDDDSAPLQGKRGLTPLFVLLLAASCTGAPEGEGVNAPADAPPRVVAHRDWNVPDSAPGGEAFGEELLPELRRALNTREQGYVPRTHHLNEDGSPVYTNRLIRETSPYLLQHAHNPVNWYAWGEEAFETARRLDRPVLLSIGYSTCHWCHVMERESFEDVEIATYMNEHFICIKVDREERPDIDAVYMDAVRMLSGRGGWPMTSVLTPDKEVFFGGTYFPARDGDRGSRIGFLTILRRLSEQYRVNREETLAQAQKLTRRLQAAAEPGPAGDLADAGPIRQAVKSLSASFDSVYGGFGRAPKFPRSVILELLLRHHRRSGDEESLHMATYTLERMSSGGMYDHVGGGFHRYSVDQRWLVPHFEKMLYDNAQLAVAYLEGYQVTGREDFARTAREVLDYVVREMTSGEGGFYSATDADSPTPSGHEEEGWFFTWTAEEIEQVVGPEAARLIVAYYGVTERGNFEGRNIFFTQRPLERVAKELGIDAEKAERDLAVVRAALYEVRAGRPPPGKDTKILTSWNGLMISAFARGARVLDEPKYEFRAKEAAEFLLENMREDDGSLRRSWKDGSARHGGVLDDYAFLAVGLMDLFETTGEPRWLTAAIELYSVLDQRFWDDENGGYYSTPVDGEALLVRQKPDYDGAEPSGNSVAIVGLLRLYEFTGEESYRARAEQALRAFSTILSRSPTAVPKMLTALDYYLDTPKEIVLVVPPEEEDESEADSGVSAFLDRLASTFLPNRVLVVTRDGAEAEAVAELMPLVADKHAQENRVTAYVCEKRVCKLPTSDPKVFARQIGTVAPYAAE